MERVSGWYKRRTQLLLLIWAAVVTIGTNADTLVIAKSLWRDPALRQALVERAEGYVVTQQRPGAAPVARAADGPPTPALPPDQQAELDFVAASARYNAALSDLAELQSTGAPFWFDMLNRIMSVRTAGKAPEEAQKPPKAVPEPPGTGRTAVTGRCGYG